MAGRPDFTVLMPTHARSDVIGLAIKSVLAQTGHSFELLVVGDGAEDGTAEEVLAFEDDRIIWLDLPKAPGFGYANRNLALQQAKGRYIAFLADDDLLFPDHLDLLNDQFDKGAMLACTRAVWVSSDGIAAPFPTNLDLQDEIDIFKTQTNNMPAGCFAYRNDALDDAAAWPEDMQLAGDWHLWKKILAAHPDIPLGVARSYSVLHFAARRRGSRYSGMPDLEVLLRYADRSDWWPAILRSTHTEDRTEQAFFQAILEQDGAEALRDALGLVTDRIAWEAVQTQIPRQRQLLSPTDASYWAATSVPDDFDAETYKALNPDIAKARIGPEKHWIKYGQFEGRIYRRK